MTSRTSRLFGIACVVGVGAAIATLIDPGGPWTGLIVLGGVVVAGELFELRPEGRPALPLSFAAFVVLDRVATVEEFLLVIVIAELAAAAIRVNATTTRRRAEILVARLLQAAAAFAAFRVANELLVDADGRVQLLVALSAAAIAPILVADALEGIGRRRFPPLLLGRSADLALVTSAILMAVSVRGIDGEVQLGFWGPLLFSIPLLAAWYSFERLANARKTYHQTIHALALAPELGELTARGHTERVAELAVTLGRQVGLGGDALEHLRIAALLHQLGSVCLDTPPDGVLRWKDIAATSAEMLRATPALAPAGDVVAATTRPHRAPVFPYAAEPISPSTALSAQVLRVASEFDDLTGGDTDPVVVGNALQTFYSGPAYVYDGRVLLALERLLERRGVAVARV